MKQIILAGKTYDIDDLPFGELRRAIKALNRMLRLGPESDEGMDETAKILGLLIRKSVDEIDAMPISLYEMNTALEQLPNILGVERRVESGEAVAVMVGTASTAT